jgi:DNA-binding CsgD family transcriptional regulator
VKLTPQEYRVAEGISRGLHDKEIAVELRLTPGTVRVYVHNALVCNHLQSRLQLGLAFVRGECELSGRRRPPNSHPKPERHRPPNSHPKPERRRVVAITPRREALYALAHDLGLIC